MTKLEFIVCLSEKGGILNGTTRPQIGRQLDYWEVDGQKYMVTTSSTWNPHSQRPGDTIKKFYRYEDVVRIEILTELL